jgi:hypothetical protein
VIKALLGAADAGVRFVLVGGLASVAQGVPMVTHDTDIVPDLDPDNTDRLFAFLHGRHARFRWRPGPPLLLQRHHLGGTGHVLLATDLGWFDVLGAIEGGRRYPDLLPRSFAIDLDGRSIQVLDLEAIVELKRASKNDKDRAQLPLLEATLAMRRR